ncbi:MAG TPA: NlpC/P60 family protein, partial [bacterium]
PYGWGGMYQNRDCSATIRDLFIPFGILLPRNGNHQAEEGFGAVDLGMLDPAEKEKTVIQKGIPFLTLLWFKGHIMLYIGHERGRALAFHNLWGIRTRTRSGEEGRYIVGEAVVTTLSPGKGLRRADPDGDLLRRIQKMVFVVPLDSVLRPATH